MMQIRRASGSLARRTPLVQRLQRPLFFSILLAAFAVALPVAPAEAQDATAPVGVAVVKDKPFYENSLAQAFAFTSMQDRTASDNHSRGYYVFEREGKTVASKEAQQVLFLFEPAELSVSGIRSKGQAEATLKKLREAAQLNAKVGAFLLPFIGRVEGARNAFQLGAGRPGPSATPTSSPAVAEADAAPIKLPAKWTVNGETYLNPRYRSHDDSRLNFSHDTGVASLLISSLPADLQKGLGYDSQKAAVSEAKAQRDHQEAALAFQQQRAQVAAISEEQVWGANNVEKWIMGGVSELGGLSLSLKPSKEAVLTLLNLSRHSGEALKGSWDASYAESGDGVRFNMRLRLKNGETLELQLATRVGGKEALLMAGDRVLGVLERRSQ